MAKVYKLNNVRFEISGGSGWWSISDGNGILNVLCQKELNKLCYIDKSKPLDICVSRTKPAHGQYLEYRLEDDHEAWFSLKVVSLKIDGMWRKIDTLLTFRKFLEGNLNSGYIWVEQ